MQLNFLYSVMSLIGAVARSFSRPDCTMMSTMDLDDDDDDDTESIILVVMVVAMVVIDILGVALEAQLHDEFGA